jgi:hypothetical protein
MYKIVLLAFVISSGCAAFENKTTADGDLTRKMEPLKKILTEKVIKTVDRYGDSIAYPRSTLSDGSWKTTPIRDWTSGFFPGILWYMSELMNEPIFKRSAEKWTQGLAPIQYYAGSHDIGFMMYCSYGNGYRITGSKEYKQVLLQTARTLMTRFNPTVGSIKSWDNKKWQFPVIIDNMMNLELLFWASKNGGSQTMYDAAVRHAETTMRNHFRPDWSTYHVIGYDTLNGNVLSKGTHQGYADNSCWSRGQAWAIYGFTMAYRFTNDKRFLATAQHAAEYFIDHLPADHVPYWDFNAPKIPAEPRDASAGAIAASALLELSGYAGDTATKDKYFSTAASILNSLSSDAYLNTGATGQGIIKHSVGSKPGGSEIDVSLIYGDYYFIEALMRYNQCTVAKVSGSTQAK